MVLPGLRVNNLEKKFEQKKINYLEEWKQSLLVVLLDQPPNASHNLNILPFIASRLIYDTRSFSPKASLFCLLAKYNSIHSSSSHGPHSNANCEFKFYAAPAMEVNRYFQTPPKQCLWNIQITAEVQGPNMLGPGTSELQAEMKLCTTPWRKINNDGLSHMNP